MSRLAKFLPGTALALLLLGSTQAKAELLKGPYEYPSAISFDGHLGLQLGLGGFTPGGGKLLLNYSHRFVSSRDRKVGVWFFADAGVVANAGAGVCGADGFAYECNAVGYGSDVEFKAGIQVTLQTPIPLVPFFKLGAGLAGVFARDRCNDSGVAVPLASGAAGLRYFFTKNWALSAQVDTLLGPAFYGAGESCFPASHNEFWRSMSFLVGAHYAL